MEEQPAEPPASLGLQSRGAGRWGGEDAGEDLSKWGEGG